MTQRKEDSGQEAAGSGQETEDSRQEAAGRLQLADKTRHKARKDGGWRIAQARLRSPSLEVGGKRYLGIILVASKL